MKKTIITAIALTLLTTTAYAQEISNDFSGFPKWVRVMNAEHVATPRSQVDLNSEASLMELLTRVKNRYKHIKYVEDIDNYGKEDYWATRAETKKKGAADCEDFAIAAYFDLVEAGVPEEDMQISIVLTKNTQEIHAYLRVRGYVLDNRSLTVISQQQADKFYTPIYSINRLGWSRD